MLDCEKLEALERIAKVLEKIAHSLSVLLEPPPKKPINGDDEEFQR